MVLFVVYVVSVMLSAYMGFRLGRIRTISKSSGHADSAASQSVADSQRTAGAAQSAVADASKANEQLGDTIHKMREILNRHNDSGSDEHGSDVVEAGK